MYLVEVVCSALSIEEMNIYRQLIRFLLPLILTAFAVEIGVQVLNGGMARMPRATETLASFGLAMGLVGFLASILTQARQLGLVLVSSRSNYRTVQVFVVLCGVSDYCSF